MLSSQTKNTQPSQQLAYTYNQNQVTKEYTNTEIQQSNYVINTPAGATFNPTPAPVNPSYFGDGFSGNTNANLNSNINNPTNFANESILDFNTGSVITQDAQQYLNVQDSRHTLLQDLNTFSGYVGVAATGVNSVFPNPITGYTATGATLINIGTSYRLRNNNKGNENTVVFIIGETAKQGLRRFIPDRIADQIVSKGQTTYNIINAGDNPNQPPDQPPPNNLYIRP